MAIFADRKKEKNTAPWVKSTPEPENVRQHQFFLRKIPCSYKDNCLKKKNPPLFILFCGYFRPFPWSEVMFRRLVLHLLGGNMHKLPKLISLPLLSREEKKR